jgi:hypothetical protein
MHWKCNKRNEHLQTSSPHKALTIAKTTRCLERNLGITKITSAGATPQASQTCNPSSPNQRVVETKLDEEHIEKQIKTATTKDDQLHLLTNIPTANF